MLSVNNYRGSYYFSPHCARVFLINASVSLLGFVISIDRLIQTWGPPLSVAESVDPKSSDQEIDVFLRCCCSPDADNGAGACLSENLMYGHWSFCAANSLCFCLDPHLWLATIASPMEAGNASRLLACFET